MDTGRGGARRCSRVLVVDRERERAEEEEGVQRERGEVQGARAAPWRREGVGEAATAKQEVAGALRARATPRLCLLAEEEEDKEGGGLGRLGGGAGPGRLR